MKTITEDEESLSHPLLDSNYLQLCDKEN